MAHKHIFDCKKNQWVKNTKKSIKNNGFVVLRNFLPPKFVKSLHIKTLELYRNKGRDVQTKHLGKPLLYAICETGNPNEYTHIWVYENAADREKKRTSMQSDPDWIKYIEESASLGALEAQNNKLVKPVDFFDFKKSLD